MGAVTLWAWRQTAAEAAIKQTETDHLNSQVKDLTAEIERTKQENTALRAQLGELASLRLEILAVLGSESSIDEEQLLKRLQTRRPEEVRAVVGKLLEDKVIEFDSMSFGSWRLRRDKF